MRKAYIQLFLRCFIYIPFSFILTEDENINDEDDI